MRGSQDLFDLIKSLSPAEKRQFKLNAKTYSKSSNSKSVALFDAIDRQEHFDDVLLQQGMQQLGIKNYRSAKYRLYGLLLESLATSAQHDSVSSQLRRSLQSVEILFDKRLYAQGKKLLNKIRAGAELYERFEFMTEIHFWERKYLLREAGTSGAGELSDFYRSFNDGLANLKTTVSYMELMDRVQTLCARYRQLHKAEDRDALEQLVSESLLTRPEQATTFVAKVTRLETLGFYRQIMGDHRAAFDYYREAIDLWEENESYLHDNLDRFKDYLSNYLTCCITLKKFGEFETAIQRLRALPAASQTAEIRMFENVGFLELWYALNRGRLEDGLRSAREIESRLPKYENDIRPNRLITLCHNCAIVYFLSGEFGKALEMLHRILNRKETSARRDIQRASRVFRLVIHYELGDMDLLENACTAGRRFLDKHAKGIDYEKRILATMKKLLNAGDEDRRQALYRTLRSGLLRIAAANVNSEPPGLIEILFWTDSKIRGISIRDAYRDRIRDGESLDVVEAFSGNRESRSATE